MNIDKIIERIEKNKEKLAKAQKLLAKRVEKAMIHAEWLKAHNIKSCQEAYLYRDTHDFDCEVLDHWLVYEDWCLDVDHNQKYYAELKIKEINAAIEKYNHLLLKEQMLNDRINEIPVALGTMFEYLKAEWLKWEKETRDNYKNALNKLGYNAFIKRYKYFAYRQAQRTDSEIEKDIETEVKLAIIDLLNRIYKIVGNIDSWQGIRWAEKALNGIIEGDKGRVKVETITAGGYNIQRLHYRVLLHKI